MSESETERSEHRYYMGLMSYGEHGSAAIVAVVNEYVGDWAAYFGTSRPHAHRNKLMADVAAHGHKLWRPHAEAIFPDLAKQYAWRD